MDTREQKKKLRKSLLKEREAIPEPEFYGASALIVEKLKQQDDFGRAETIHCYVSINRRREVETRELIKELLGKGKKVVVPVTNFEEGTLTHVRLTSYDKLKRNKWGVLEPMEGKNVPVDEINFIIVPMVGADEECNRIGYGKGFYDRFLKEATCPKVGLSFEQNVVKRIPTEDFDIPMNKIITEKRIIQRQ